MHYAHHDALLSHGRCGRCAERVPPVAILRGADCPRCESPLRWHGVGDVLGKVQPRHVYWRIVGYLLVAAVSFQVGLIPLLQVAVQVLAILVLHVLLLRRPLDWLPPARRITARLTIKLLGAALACVALLINVAVAPALGISAPILGLTGLVLTAAYVEVGLLVVRQRLRWESEGRGLSVVEWGLPVGLITVLVAALVGTIGTTMGTLHLLVLADIPTISDVARFLLEV